MYKRETLAAFRGHADVIDALAEAGVDLNAADGRGRTPASIAVNRLLKEGDDSLSALLIELNVTVFTPLPLNS